MRYLNKLITVIFILIIVCACQNVNTIQPHLAFEDDRLEAYIESLANENEIDFIDELHTIKKLDLTNFGVVSLEGIHVLEGLEEIILSGNDLDSLEPLLRLPNLQMVNFENVTIDTKEHSNDIDVIQELLERQIDVIYDKEEEQIFSKGLLYQVEHNENSIFLFGTVYVNSEDLFPLHPFIEDAFDQADQIAFVVNVNEKDEVAIMQAMVELGVYNDGTSLEEHISEELYNELLTFIGNYDLEQEAILRFKPWAVAICFNH
ncbi:TraB/GumN family protein [Bacillus sp. JCM 19034]|uniref:TraB/GumN family protein n=1 Tax=Bacillus sp. JCM 19034 TaxID=1481928 RepID=UPI000784677D|nr:TraB/GumN family protein [Bacillus sp. JCM 19034]